MVIVYKNYRIIADEDKYRVAENFGAYRILKKKFNTIIQAKMRINALTEEK